MNITSNITRAVLLAAAVAAGWTAPAAAAPAAKEVFGRMSLPAVGEAQSYGFYSKGCIAGAVALPVNGPHWQVMRLERNRRWGHPALVSFIEKLSEDVSKHGWPGLLVGDMSQPRGGPMLSGHASHQIGLDVDLWLTKMPDRRLTTSERSNMSAGSVLKHKKMEVDPAKWSKDYEALLYRTASFDQVQRIFVNPAIKKLMCDKYGGSKANDSWMIKLRPYYGHDDHIHVRLFCPPGSPGCKPQHSVGSGNGCGKSLAWWFTDEPWAPAKPKKNAKPAKPHVTTVSDLPNACTGVLNDPAPADVSLVTYTPGYTPDLAAKTAVPSSPPTPGSARMQMPAVIPVPVPRPAH